MLSDRERQVLNDLERHLEHENPSWVSRFNEPTSKSVLPPPRARRNLILETAIGLLTVLIALSVSFGFSQGILAFASAAAVLAYVRYHPLGS